jgi:energy-coupling factor transporter ATP-binding protein EcfA2
MNEDLERVTYFAETDARNKRVRFGIKKKDRSKHMYVIGKTGMGKSTLLENLAIQDIQNGEGLAFIDPHGKTADLLLEYVPEHRIKDVIYFAPFDLDHPVSFNVLEDVGVEKRHLVVNGLMSAFKRIWVDAFSARMEYILSNIMLALLEYPDSTLMGVNRMLVDKEFRNTVVNNITDPSVRSFWVDEYAKYTEKFAAEAAPAIQNKVGQFVANPLVRNIIGQAKSSFDIREIMDNKKILIINLSKGRVGEANANLLGAMIITKIYLAAMSRADMSETELKKSAEFYLYVDEFQSFANESFADILSEARKYKLALVIAHQYIEQMTEEVRAAVFGNVGTMAVYRVGAYDAAVFEKEFVPQFTAEDLVNLQQYQLYLKLMIDGVTSPPFSAMGMTPIAKAPTTYVKEIIDSSRAQFAKPRAGVEDVIRQWHLDKIPPGPNAVNSTGGAGGHGAGQSGYGGQSGKSNAAPASGGYTGSKPYGAPTPPRPSAPSIAPRNFDQGHAPRNGDRDTRGDRNERSGSGFGERPRTGDSSQRPRDFSRDNPRNSSNTPRNDTDRNINRDRRRDEPTPAIKTEKPFAKAFEVLQSAKPEDNNEQSITGPADREKSLRDAVSLNYLKDKKEDDIRAKNTAKEAKPQNILDLKNALLGILGDSAPQQVEQAHNSAHPHAHSEAVKPERQHPHASHEKAHEKKHENASGANKHAAAPEPVSKSPEVDYDTLSKLLGQ